MRLSSSVIFEPRDPDHKDFNDRFPAVVQALKEEVDQRPLQVWHRASPVAAGKIANDSSTFAIDDDPAVIAERVRETLDESEA